MARPTLKQDAAIKMAVALANPDRVAGLQDAHDLVTEVDVEIRPDYGNAVAIAVYEMQRARCSCGASFSRLGRAQSHAADEGHGDVQPGMKYNELAAALGLTNHRIQQLVSKGRRLVAGASNGNGAPWP